MGNVPQPTSIIDDTRASSLSNGNYNGARVKKTSTASSQKAERIDRVSYRNRGCRSCFSVHDPRRPIEKQLESDAERMKSAAQRLFEVKGDRMLDRLTQDDIDRIVEDEPQRLRDLPDLRGKGAAEIMRYFNKYGRFESSESSASHSGNGSSYWITVAEMETATMQWAAHRAALSTGVHQLRHRLGTVHHGDCDAIAAELAKGFLDDLLPELYGMEAKMIVTQLRLGGKRNISADALLEQIVRIAITERMTFSFSGYENVLQRQALCLFNRYDIGQRSVVPKSIVVQWITNHQLNLSRAQHHASSCHQMSNAARLAMANEWLGTINDRSTDVWTRTELMTLLHDIGPQTHAKDVPVGDLVVPPDFVKSAHAHSVGAWPELGVWSIIIHEAKDLPRELGSDADGYVYVYGQQSADGPHLQKAWTQKVDNNSHPQFGGWKYERTAAADEVIVLQVWDQDTVTSDDLIGQCVVMLAEYQSPDQWYGGVTIARGGEPVTRWLDIVPLPHVKKNGIHVNLHIGRAAPKPLPQLRVQVQFRPLVPALSLLPNWPRYQFKTNASSSSSSSLPLRALYAGVNSLLPIETKRSADSAPSYQRAPSSSVTKSASLAPTFTTSTTPSIIVATTPHAGNERANDHVAVMLNGTYTTPTSLSFVPSCIVVDHDQSLLVCDRVRSRIVRLSTSGEMKHLVGAGDGLAAPVSLAIYDATRYIIVDAKHRALFMMTPLESFGARIGGAMTVTPFGPRGLFQSPSSVVVTSEGYIMVSDAATNLIHMVNRDGVASLFVGSGYAQSDDGTGCMASIACPIAMAIDTNDHIYVAQAAPGLAAVRMITPDGQVTTIAGATSVEPNQPLHRDGMACIKKELGDLVEAAHIASSIRQLTTSIDDRKADAARSFVSSMNATRATAQTHRRQLARFGTCSGIAVDGQGGIYVADCDTRTIRYIHRAANRVITIAGPRHGDAEPNYIDDAQDATAARFRSPVIISPP